MDLEAVRPLPSVPCSPCSVRGVESDVASIVSSLESLGPPPEPFPPLEQLLQTQPRGDEDAGSDAATICYDYDDMTDIDVVGIQRACADILTHLVPADTTLLTVENQYLARALSDLLEATYELETFHPSCSISSPHTPPDDSVPAPASPFDSLLRVLSAVQTAATKRRPNPLALPDTPSTSCDMHPAVSAVREELAWARVESCSQAVIQLVRERTQHRDESLAAHALPPKYRRSERNSSEGSESLKSLPPYNAHRNDTALVDSTLPPSPPPPLMEKPITGAGDRKARMEEEAALEEAERRRAASGAASPTGRRPRPLHNNNNNKMGGILNELDTVTHAIERLQSFSQLQDQRVELRPASAKRYSVQSSFAQPGPSTEKHDPARELDSIIGSAQASATDRLDDQRYDVSRRRASRRQKLLVNTLEDTARTLEDQHGSLSAEGNLARARDLRDHGKLLNTLLDGAPNSASGVSDHKPKYSSVGIPGANSTHPLTYDQDITGSHHHHPTTTTAGGPSSFCQDLSERKSSNRRMFLYDDGPFAPQCGTPSPRRTSESDRTVASQPRSLSPASMEFMYKELPLPPDHEPRSRSVSRDTIGGAGRSLSPSSDYDNESTIPTRRARSPPPRGVRMGGSRSSSMARVPLRQHDSDTRSLATSAPMSPTFSDISITSSRMSAPRAVPITTTIDDHFLHRLSAESKISSQSKGSKVSSKPSSIRVKMPRSPSAVNVSKPPSVWSSPRSPSSRSLARPKVDRQEDLFDLLSMATSSSRMSNQEVELPTTRRRLDLTPKADWAGLDQGSNDAPITPRIVESVADGEWVIRLQDHDTGNLMTPRTPYSALPSSSSLKFSDLPRSARRSSFSSMVSSSNPPTPGSVSSPNGFKRFATSFKNSTLNRKSTKARPAPLRTSGILDGSAVTYMTEYQENLRSIQVLIAGVDTTFLNTADLQLEVNSPNDAILVSKSDPTLRVLISLPSPAPVGAVAHLQPVDDYLEAKLPAVSMASGAPGSLLHTTVSHALSAPNLRSLAPRSLCCTSCDRVVAHLPLDVEFKDLPSEYWAEMIEVWMCHADPAFTSQLAKHTSDGFWPSPDTVLVGGSYLLVSGSHICDSHLILEKSNEPDQWRIISCPCGEVLGKLRPEDGRPGAGTVRFSKWAIALLRGKGAGEISPVRFPVSTFVVSDMLELSQAHASHRFIICDERTGDRRLAIWVFNPSIRVAYRRGNGGGLSAAPDSPLKGTFGRHLNGRHGRHPNPADILPVTRTLRAAKIMFKVLEPYSPHVDFETLPGFGATGQVEHLRYARDVCVTLIETLRASAALYPPSRQNMGSFEVGFLERI